MVCEPLRGVGCVTQSCKRSCSPALALRLACAAPEDRAFRGCRLAHRAEADLTPDSVSFADSPALKFVFHDAVVETFQVSKHSGQVGGQAKNLAEYQVVQMAVEQVFVLVVSGVGGALSIGSQKSVEDPGAVVCGS